MTQYSHDVAISAVSYDAMLVADVSERCGQRLGGAVFWRSPSRDALAGVATEQLGVVENSARVVVVLHQRLWGHDPATAADAAALRDRMKARRHKSVLVVTLDETGIPSWLKSAPTCSVAALGVDAVCDVVIAAVVAAGGDALAKPVVVASEPAVVRPVWSDGQPTFMAQPRAQSALKRELDALTTELAERVRMESDRSGDTRIALHSAPSRVVVQLGDVGLSLSWVAGRSGNLADGRLMVIEWDGAITHGRAMGGAKTASPTRERSYRPEAKGPDDWCWRPETGEGTGYSSRNLAGQCFTSANMGRTA